MFDQDFPSLVLLSILISIKTVTTISKLELCFWRFSANANISSKAAGFPELAPRSSKLKEVCIIATAVHAF